MWVALFRWFKSIMDNVIKNNSATMSALLTKTDAQNDVLNDCGRLASINLVTDKEHIQYLLRPIHGESLPHYQKGT